jgi:RNA polymerase sigma-70 factor (ECF subfamily)
MNGMNVSRQANAGLIGPDERAYVFAVVRRILRDEDDANDATQDTLLLAYRHRDQFRGESAYRTWLHRIAVMTALGLLRKQRRQRLRMTVSMDEPSVVNDVVDPRPTPEATVAAKQLASRVERALEQLTATYRDVVLMRVHEWRESEIAAELGISVANVKIRTHRARERLRGALAQP